MEDQISGDTDTTTFNPSTDRLTGLFNRDAFQVILEWESSRSRRYGTSFTLALLDIDLGSPYTGQNDTSKRDAVLSEIARIIRTTIRRCDMAARYSDTLFALILANYPALPSHTAVERTRSRLEAHTRGGVTLSAGLATCPQDATYGNQLLDKAQEFLAIARERGENRTYFPTSEEQPAITRKPRILLVGDPEQISTTEGLFTKPALNCELIKTHSKDEILLLATTNEADLVLIDTLGTEPDGYEVCRRFKENERTATIPLIMLSPVNDVQGRIRAIELGADDCMIPPPDRLELITRIRSLLKTSALKKKFTSIENVLISLANAVEAKDVYTQGHSVRVSDLSVELGKRMARSENEIEALRLGGILHDVGKIGIPGEILNRPGKLTPDEFEIVKAHPGAGCDICLPLQKTLGLALDIVRHHHERLDGSGYPDGLRGEDISIIARIAGIVDIFDALVANRPYRGPKTREEAFEILQEEAAEGKLDKEIVGHFIEMTKGS